MRILCAESLKRRNSLALPATAEALVSVQNEQQLREALAWADNHNLPVVPLGEGSNVVFTGDLRALALHLANRGIEILDRGDDHVLLRVAAGENWHSLVEWCLAKGCHGLENLALIPGTVGAAPIQNIGAYGVELDTLLERVLAIDIGRGSAASLSAAECQLGYRDSVFKGRLRDRLVITAVELRLHTKPHVRADYPALARYLEERGTFEPCPRDIFDAVVAIRRSKLPDPAVEPNVGSFFKNPLLDADRARAMADRFAGLPVYPHTEGLAKLPAAWMIDHCGWKGHREGDVGVHPDHALVIVNYGSGTGAEVMALAGRIARSVDDRFGIQLEIEPRVYGR